jgi:CBS domain containing-hemolysin-like protein
MMAAVLWTSLGVLALVILNGLYVATEFALIGSRRSQLETMARTGRRRARKVLALISDLKSMDRAIAAIQVGITCASLGLGMYGEHAVASLLRPLLADLGPLAGIGSHGLASLLAVLILTYLHIVIGEVVPKSIALQNPARTAMWVEPPLRFTDLVLRPFVVALSTASGLILKLLRIRPAAEAARAFSLDELDSVIEESGAGGMLQAEQAVILANLVDFEDLQVRQVMIPRNQVTGLPSSAAAATVMEILHDTKHSRYPLYEEDLDDVLGYVHVKDIMRALDAGGVFDLRALQRPVPHIPETASCTRLLRLLRKRRAHMAVALDEHGGTAGIVTLENLVEEIIGEVQDEFDAEEPPVRVVGAGVAVAMGSCRLDEINSALALVLEDDQVETLAGLVLKHLGRMALPGDTIRVEGVRLTVESVERFAITRVRLEWNQGGQGGSPASNRST